MTRATRLNSTLRQVDASGAYGSAADVGYDVILVAGQSNAVGYGQGLDATYFDTVQPRIVQYAGASSPTYAGQVVAAVEPLFHHKLPPSTDRIGFAMTFAREYVKTLPFSRNVMIVPVAHGDTGFSTTNISPAPTGYHLNGASDGGCWDPAATDGGFNLAAYAAAQANAALALSPTSRLVGILWHQGEADGGYLTQAQYAAALDRLVTYLRAQITGAAQVPFLLGQMVPTYTPITSAISKALVDTPNRNARCAFAYGPANYVNSSEAYHYNATGQRILGKQYWRVFPYAKAGTAAPVVIPPDGPIVAAAGVIDSVGVAAVRAYSTRLLRTAYTGKAINVRRSSDSTTADIGFTAAGDLDTTALLAFAGSGSAYVATWYDQSGNGRDFTQATAAQQPRIVNAGVVDKGNGTKPMLVFDGAATNMQSAVAAAYANGVATTVLVATNNNTGTGGVYSESGTAADSRYYIYAQSNGSTDLQIKNDAATVVIDNAKSGTTAGIHQYTYLDTGAAVTTAFDGTGSTTAYTRSTTTLTRSTLGARRDTSGNVSSWFLGTMAELVIFAGALTTAQQTTAQSNEKAYFGTP